MMPLDHIKRWSLIDIGLNLTDKMFQGKYNGSTRHSPDLVDMLGRAQRAGVHGALLTGGNLKDSERVVRMCEQYTVEGFKCLCTVGCHPTRCSEFVPQPDKYLESLEALITANSVHAGGCVAAIGEIGLDYDRLFFCEKDVQCKYFEAQLNMAEKHKLPLFLHDRNTAGDFQQHIRRHVSRLSGGVVHSFTGTREELEVYLDLGFYIGVNGCSLKTQDNLDIVRQIPLDRIMLETDAPWCDIRNTHASRAVLNDAAGRSDCHTCVSDAILKQFPTCKKEKFIRGAIVKGRSEPCNVVQILEVLYELHKDDVESLDSLQEQILANTRELFPF